MRHWAENVHAFVLGLPLGLLPQLVFTLDVLVKKCAYTE